MMRPATPVRASTTSVVLAWALAGVSLLIFILATLLTVWELSALDRFVFLALPITFGGVGALLVTRVPGNRIGWLLLVAIVDFALLAGAQVYVLRSIALDAPLPGTAFAAWLTSLLFVPGVVLVLVGIPLIFPTGRLLSPRWRAVVVLSALAVVASMLRPMFAAGDLMGVEGLANPFALDGMQPWLGLVDTASVVLGIPMLMAAFGAVVLRFRRGSRVERQQIKVLAVAAAAELVLFSITFVGPILGPDTGAVESIAVVGLIAFPVAIGFAILRYRLYEIDRLISRTLSYAIVTTTLLIVFASVVFSLTALLSSVTEESTVAVAASTLVVAALFQPLLARVRRVIDRRFDRARYDADRTAAAFAGRLRDQVELDGLRRDLQDVVTETVAPSNVGLWLGGR